MDNYWTMHKRAAEFYSDVYSRPLDEIAGHCNPRILGIADTQIQTINDTYENLVKMGGKDYLNYFTSLTLNQPDIPRLPIKPQTPWPEYMTRWAIGNRIATGKLLRLSIEAVAPEELPEKTMMRWGRLARERSNMQVFSEYNSYFRLRGSAKIGGYVSTIACGLCIIPNMYRHDDRRQYFRFSMYREHIKGEPGASTTTLMWNASVEAGYRAKAAGMFRAGGKGGNV